MNNKNNKNLRNLIITIVLAGIGIAAMIIGFLGEEMPFGIAGLGIALAGISIQTYIKNTRDRTTEKGEKRSEIEMHDERNVLINAKSGETVNFIMSGFTLIAAVLSVYLNVSVIGQTLIFSLLIISLIIRPIVKRYYENRL